MIESQLREFNCHSRACVILCDRTWAHLLFDKVLSGHADFRFSEDFIEAEYFITREKTVVRGKPLLPAITATLNRQHVRMDGPRVVLALSHLVFQFSGPPARAGRSRAV